MKSFCFLPSSGFRACALALASVLLLGACAHDDAEFDTPGLPKRKSLEGRLLGEWVQPGARDHYLVFKGDPTEEHTGRILGLDDFEHYKVAGSSKMNRRIKLDVTPTEDVRANKAWLQITFEPDFEMITVEGAGVAAGVEVRSYRREREAAGAGARQSDDVTMRQ